MSDVSLSTITNIDISKDYDETQGTDDVHYQTFGKMAAFLVVICKPIVMMGFPTALFSHWAYHFTA